MKKIKSICLVMFALFFLTGCSKNYEFSEGTHAREEGYEVSFRTKYVVLDGLTLHMRESIFDENAARKAAEAVTKDYKKIKKVGKGLEDEIAVYLVDKTLSGNPQVTENKLYCTIEDIQSGEYRTCLTSASFQIPCLWKSIGLELHIFSMPSSENIVKNGDLKSYYEEEENIPILSLLPVYFLEDFSDESDRNMAKSTALSFTEYVIEEVGLSEYLSMGNMDEYRKEWLQEIGLAEIPDSFKINGDTMKNFEIESYSIVIEHENCMFYLSPTDWLKEADDVYFLFADWVEGRNAILSDLEVREPDTYEIVSERMKEQRVDVYFINSDEPMSYALKNGSVYIADKSDIYHEVFHVLLPGERDEEIWLEEGIITLLTMQIQSDYMGESKALFWECITDKTFFYELSQEDKVFMNHVKEYYLEKAPIPMEVTDLEFTLVYEALGKITLKEPELSTSLNMAIIDVYQRRMGSLDNPPGKGANRLTYPQAYVFSKYLAENYGLDTVVEVMIGRQTFEEAFQGDFEEVFSEFVEEISY